MGAPRESRELLKGRLRGRLSEEAKRFLSGRDIEYDSRLIEEELDGSEAHAVMLWKCGIIGADDARRIIEALEKLRELHGRGEFRLSPDLEDVHLNVEAFVIAEAGMDAGGRLHIGRSRNDQILLDVRMKLRKELNEISHLALDLAEALLKLARGGLETVMPGYTHLQRAMPITLAHWALSYVEMLLRDVERLGEAYGRINLCPLGACALAGTDWPIDRRMVAELLGFDGVQRNSLDVISSRGEFEAEALAALSILMAHLSKLASDLVLWSSEEFGFVELSDEWSTGSSVMPQKKNPDAAELIRAKAHRVHSSLLSALSIASCLPSGYFRDMQELKPALFDALDDAKGSLRAAIGVVSTMEARADRMAEAARSSFITAADLANFLARERGLPFRLAYQIAAAAARRYAEAGRISAPDVEGAAKELGVQISLSEGELAKILDPLESVRAKKSLGGASPEEASKGISEAEAKLRRLRAEVEARERRLAEAKARLRAEVGGLLRGSR